MIKTLTLPRVSSGGNTMLRTMLVAGAVVALIVPVAAQSPQAASPQSAAPPAQPAQQPDDPAKPSVVMFEMGLQRAIEAGGAKFAQRALEVVPGVHLTQTSAAIVRGYPVPDFGFAFDVQIPDILDSGMALVMMDQRSRRPPLASGQAQGVRPISSGTTSAAGGVTADPMTSSPVLDFADPNAFYTACVKEAIIDAMIDNSIALPLTEKTTLLIVASGFEQRLPANSLYRTKERKLILTVKGADLAEYRAGKIVREQLKERIKESKF